MNLIRGEKSVWLVGNLGNREEKNFKGLFDVEFLVTLILVCTGIVSENVGNEFKLNCVVMNLYVLFFLFLLFSCPH